MSEFFLDRALSGTRVGPNEWEVELDAVWNNPNQTPNGGYLLGLVLAAAKSDSPLPDPLVASVTYLRPTRTPVSGRIKTAIVRAGRTVATLEATLFVNDEPTTHLVASFIDRSATSGTTLTTPDYEKIPDVDQCVDSLREFPPDIVPFAQHFVYRHPVQPSWIVGKPSGVMRANFWMKPSDDRPIDELALSVMVDAYPPVVMEIGEQGSATIQLTVHFRAVPVSSWVQMCFKTDHVINGFHEEDVDVYDYAGNLVAQSRQLSIMHLKY